MAENRILFLEESCKDHDKRITNLENKDASYSVMCEAHTCALKENAKDIADIKITTAKYETKLDITNKILGAIAVMLASSIVALIFKLLTHNVKI